MQQLVEPEECQRGKVHGVIGMQVGEEDAPQVRQLQTRLAQPSADAVAAVHEVEPFTDDDGGGDAGAGACGRRGPPLRAAGGAQGDDLRR